MDTLSSVLPFACLLLFSSSAADDVGCYDRGECAGGNVLGHSVAGSAEECSAGCDAYGGCGYFTHFWVSGGCFLFDACPDFNLDCFDCVSGRNGCSCFQVGKCQGHTIHTGYTADEFGCLDDCRGQGACEWITYSTDTRLCTLLKECPSVDGDFAEDLSAPKHCSGNSSDEDPMYILAALGSDGDVFTDDVEIVHLGAGNTTSSNCTKLPAYPFGMTQPDGAFVDGKARVCGGHKSGTSSPYTADCYEYAIGDAEWTKSDFSMSTEREFQESFVLANGSWLIVGGYQPDAKETTDIYQSGQMTRGPDLPEGFTYPVGTVVNSSHLFLAGSSPRNTSYLVDADRWEFTRMPEFPAERWHFSCGMVENKDGVRELVVAGGVSHGDPASIYTNSSHIFNFEQWEWRDGPEMPSKAEGTNSVQLSKTFLVMGGIDGDNEILDTIFEFDTVNWGWITRDQRLAKGRRYFAAMALPDEWEACTY